MNSRMPASGPAAVNPEPRPAPDAVVAADPTLERHPALAAVMSSLLASEQARYLEKS